MELYLNTLFEMTLVDWLWCAQWFLLIVILIQVLVWLGVNEYRPELCPNKWGNNFSTWFLISHVILFSTMITLANYRHTLELGG